MSALPVDASYASARSAQDKSDLRGWDNIVSALEAAQSTVRDQQMNNAEQAKLKTLVKYFLDDALDDARHYRSEAAEAFGLAEDEG